MAELYPHSSKINRTRRIVIDYALDSLKDIKSAERRKAKAENDGYTLVSEKCSLTTGRLIYELKTK